jgi:hypothetical protein
MSMKIKEDNLFRTSDLALATVISLSFSIELIDKENPSKAYFVFRKTRALDEAVEKYWRGDLKVEPQQYHAQLRVIKARLYAQE